MKPIIFLTALVILCMTIKEGQAQAQPGTSIGIRIGGTSGLSAKYFYRNDKCVEGILGTFGNGFSITGLIEKYSPVYNATGLYVYYGGGMHLAFYNGKDHFNSYFGRETDYHKNNDVGVGINGIVGIEYRLSENIPIAISLDLKPFIEMGSYGYVSFAPDPSLGVKFIIR